MIANIFLNFFYYNKKLGENFANALKMYIFNPVLVSTRICKQKNPVWMHVLYIYIKLRHMIEQDGKRSRPIVF